MKSKRRKLFEISSENFSINSKNDGEREGEKIKATSTSISSSLN